MSIGLQDVYDITNEALHNGNIEDISNIFTIKIKEKEEKIILAELEKNPCIKIIKDQSQYSYWAGSVYFKKNKYYIIPIDYTKIDYTKIDKSICDKKINDIRKAYYQVILEDFLIKHQCKNLVIIINTELGETIDSYKDILKLLHNFLEVYQTHNINIKVFDDTLINNIQTYIKQFFNNTRIKLNDSESHSTCYEVTNHNLNTLSHSINQLPYTVNELSREYEVNTTTTLSQNEKLKIIHESNLATTNKLTAINSDNIIFDSRNYILKNIG